MVYNGMELGSFFEIPWNSPCYQVLRGINPILQMIFTFSQLYFVFMNARVRKKENNQMSSGEGRRVFYVNFYVSFVSLSFLVVLCAKKLSVDLFFRLAWKKWSHNTFRPEQCFIIMVLNGKFSDIKRQK